VWIRGNNQCTNNYRQRFTNRRSQHFANEHGNGGSGGDG
jgi:hypothetical protein